MKQSIVHVSLVVNDYDEAIAFYTQKLNFTLVEDIVMDDAGKRWVLVAPPGSQGIALLLAKASNSEQAEHIGSQTGGRVFLFLSTDNFARDYTAMKEKGITFTRGPNHMEYGTVAVFKDLYGNLWDLIEYKDGHPFAQK
ncbi:VOC family protein [Agarilytica rhodophyticola]|uniref:VOC family protein n=1 Tax=Agarilytica rhodophyticola TaxID=1737490 RepID=UPI000B3421BB|nr:VOC family protein [Agarilytica rhodophyticola]